MGKLYSSKRKMRPKPIFMLVVGLLICWLSVWSAGVAIGSQPVQGEAGVDLLLLVDASDSMKVLDRDRLADQIARSVLRYLVEDVPGDTTSRVGIFCFSDKMTPLLKLTPLSEVELEQVSVECERGGGTLFAKILEEVPSVFRAEPRPENRKVILLITDGHPSYSGESVLVEDEVNRNYLLGNVVPKISALQELDEKPTLHVIGVGETKFVDFWSQYNFTRVEDSDHLLRIGALLAELFPVAPPPIANTNPGFHTITFSFPHFYTCAANIHAVAFSCSHFYTCTNIDSISFSYLDTITICDTQSYAFPFGHVHGSRAGYADGAHSHSHPHLYCYAHATVSAEYNRGCRP